MLDPSVILHDMTWFKHVLYVIQSPKHIVCPLTQKWMSQDILMLDKWKEDISS